MNTNASQQAAAPSYYGYPFLDELHNFFPDFLYNNQRFTSVNQVFGYLNTQMNNRFNLYSSARAQHQRQQQQQPQQQSISYFDDMNYINNNTNNNINNIRPAVRVAPGISVVSEPRLAAAPMIDLFSTEFIFRDGLGNDGIAGLAGLASLLVPEVQPRNLMDLFMRIPGFADPVLVHPSATQIATSTTEGSCTTTQGDVCAICQDDIVSGCQIRTINHCAHKFHRGCIDTWFAQNVHCPVCRHDIRSAPQERHVEDDNIEDYDEDDEDNTVD